MNKTILLLLSVFMTVFAYEYASAAEEPEIFVQLGHTKEVKSCSIFPDGGYHKVKKLEGTR